MKNAVVDYHVTMNLPEKVVKEIVGECGSSQQDYEAAVEAIEDWVFENFAEALNYATGDPEVEALA